MSVKQEQKELGQEAIGFSVLAIKSPSVSGPRGPHIKCTSSIKTPKSIQIWLSLFLHLLSSTTLLLLLEGLFASRNGLVSFPSSDFNFYATG